MGDGLLSALLGALVGGGLSILGALFAINQQAKKQIEEREKVALDFFKFLLTEQANHLSELAKERLKDKQSVDQYNLQLSLANYSLYERNREQLTYLTDLILRKDVSDIMTRMQAISWVLSTSCNNITTLNSGGVIQGNAGSIQFNEKAIDECYMTLSDLKESCDGTLSKFITMDPGSSPG